MKKVLIWLLTLVAAVVLPFTATRALAAEQPTTVPSAPRTLTAAPGDGMVTISWNPPSGDGGSAITGYQVSSDNGATWMASSSDSGHIFTGLTNGVEYTFKVRAVNGVGAGSAAMSIATPRVIVTVPSAPQYLTAVPAEGQVTLLWTAPASNGGSVITGYQVSSDGGATWEESSSYVDHTFMGLTNGITYTFKVRAVNSAGHGGEASVSETLISVEPSEWAKEGVWQAISLGLVPHQLQYDYTGEITRADFCALAVAFYEMQTGRVIHSRQSFTDTVDVSVEKLAGLGIIDGFDDEVFDPYKTLDRQTATVMLVKLLESMGFTIPKVPTTFADAGSMASWAVVPIGQAQAVRLVNGVGGNMFNPQDKIDRQSGILIILNLYNFLNK